MKIRMFLLSIFIFMHISAADPDPMGIRVDVEQQVSGCDSGECDTPQIKMQDLLAAINKIGGLFSNYELELKSLKDVVETKLEDFGRELQSLKDAKNSSLSEENSKLNNYGCPEGFFQVSASAQCFKYFGTYQSYYDANATCIAEGLLMPMPYDPMALQTYIMMKYAPVRGVWLGAIDDGTSITWERDGRTLDRRNPMFHDPDVPLKAGNCLTLWAPEQSENLPFDTSPCTHPFITMCELPSE